jgi:hypothetical protein
LSAVEEPVPAGKITLAVCGLVTGIIIILLPQVGVLVCFMRIYNIATGNTCRVLLDVIYLEVFCLYFNSFYDVRLF